MPFIFDQQILSILVVVSLAINVMLLLYVARNERRMRRIFKGNDINNLEQFLVATEKRLRELDVFRAKTEQTLALLTESVRHGARKIGVVRFNPFGKKGGVDQSFSAAFVNEDGDGIILSGLYIRDRLALFAKPLTRNQSEHELSAEEKKAIQKAHMQNKYAEK